MPPQTKKGAIKPPSADHSQHISIKIKWWNFLAEGMQFVETKISAPLKPNSFGSMLFFPGQNCQSHIIDLRSRPHKTSNFGV